MFFPLPPHRHPKTPIVQVLADGYTQVARAGRLVQEVRVTTALGPDEMRAAVARVLSELA